jgi:hypothetical protein
MRRVAGGQGPGAPHASLCAGRLFPNTRAHILDDRLDVVLHNHILAASHYRHLYRRDVTDAALAARVKRHLTQVILRLVGRLFGIVADDLHRRVDDHPAFGLGPHFCRRSRSAGDGEPGVRTHRKGKAQ